MWFLTIVSLPTSVFASTYQMLTVAGNGIPGTCPHGGVATAYSVQQPAGVFVDSSNQIYFSDYFNHKIRKVVNGLSYIHAGSDAFVSGADNIPATASSFQEPFGVWGDLVGNTYVSDYSAAKIRKINPATGIISTFVGTGVASSTTSVGDGGMASSATLKNEIFMIHGTSDSTSAFLFIADNTRIRKVSLSTLIITTVAGSDATVTFTEGGQATAGTFLYAWGVFVNSVGKLYVSENTGAKVRTVTTTSIITTFVGMFLSVFIGSIVILTFFPARNRQRFRFY